VAKLQDWFPMERHNMPDNSAAMFCLVMFQGDSFQCADGVGGGNLPMRQIEIEVCG
jgi:hypothetical protein